MANAITMPTNAELELAFNYVSQTNRHLFLTGKAGTGKTTFLHRVRQEVPKRMAVVAPTGVAAINAGGVTIHSLFQLPFGVIAPGKALAHGRRFSRKKISLLRGLDLLVIDEISMVRADVLDGIDEVLRRLRANNAPFGGLQLLLIGDLHQLSPVVKDRDRAAMRQHYVTPFFFGSRALRQATTVTIELQKVYRQVNRDFVDLLNHVRNNELLEEDFALINARHRPDFVPPEEEGYITLTSHKQTARLINTESLERQVGPRYEFQAEVEGDFPASMYPQAARQVFKIGAQVMFTKNDHLNQEYYNGKIGRITAIADGVIHVRCPGEERALAVSPVSWENRKYELDKSSGEVREDIVGTFTQYPLRLAWAITIHKSQGLTFDRVVIDAAAAFAPGQVYVALSRCKTLDGIVLRTPLPPESVRTDLEVLEYGQTATTDRPNGATLAADMLAYQYYCLSELFGCERLRRAMAVLRRHLLEHERSLVGSVVMNTEPLWENINQDLILVGQRFVRILDGFARRGVPLTDATLTERLAAATSYFRTKLRQDIRPHLD
ncbi:MAG: AAA family ATPase, partial [Bacteroidota bacterium]